MFHKLLLIPALMIGTALFLTESSAKADVSARVGMTDPAPVYVAHHSHYYRVVYRASCNDPWITYQVVHSFDQANRIAHQLRHRGYETLVSHN